MWSDKERHELSIWADELQSRGDPRGELILVSQRLEALEASGAAGRDLARTRGRLAALQARLAGEESAQILQANPQLHARWEHGVLVSLALVDRRRHEPSAARLDADLTRLLSLPVARFVRELWLDPQWPADGPSQHSTLVWLSETQTEAALACLPVVEAWLADPLAGAYRSYEIEDVRARLRKLRRRQLLTRIRSWLGPR